MFSNSSYTFLKRIARNPAGRDFVVGDIHGYFGALNKALKRIGFDISKDRLFSVGDLVDRGPESAQVLEWLALPWFYAVQGNHEVMILRGLAGHHGFLQCHQENGGEWFYALALEKRFEIGLALSNLPLAIEVETDSGGVGIVHADFPADDWRAFHKKEPTAFDVEYCQWGTKRFMAEDTQIVKNIHALIHGHVNISKPLHLGNVYFIDTRSDYETDKSFTILNLSSLNCVHGPGGVKSTATSSPSLKGLCKPR